MLHCFEKRRGEACYLFELVGQVCNAAVVQLVSNFGKVELIINKQFFLPVQFYGK